MKRSAFLTHPINWHNISSNCPSLQRPLPEDDGFYTSPDREKLKENAPALPGAGNRKEQQNRLPDLNALPISDVPAMRKSNLQVELIADEGALDNAELERRVLKRVANVPGTDILVVSHRVLIRELTNTNEDVDNCSVVSCTLEQGSIENVGVEV